MSRLVRIAVFALALALLLGVALGSPLEARDEKKHHDRHPADKKDHGPPPAPPAPVPPPQPPKKHDDDHKKHPNPPKKHHVPTVVVTKTVPVVVTATQTLVPTIVPVNVSCLPFPVFHPPEKKDDGHDRGFFTIDEAKVKLLFVKKFGGYVWICKATNEIFVFVVKAEKWFKVIAIPLCPPKPPAPKPEPPKKHDRRDLKKNVQPVTVTQTITAVSTQTIGVLPPCVDPICPLPIWKDDGKKDGGHFVFPGDKGEDVKAKVVIIKELGIAIYICDSHIYAFVFEKGIWVELVLVPVVFPPPPTTAITKTSAAPTTTAAPPAPPKKDGGY